MNRETKIVIVSSDWTISGMYLIRLAFAAVGLKQAEQKGRGDAGWPLSGVREPLFPPEMRPSLPASPTNDLFPYRSLRFYPRHN